MTLPPLEINVDKNPVLASWLPDPLILSTRQNMLDAPT